MSERFDSYKAEMSSLDQKWIQYVTRKGYGKAIVMYTDLMALLKELNVSRILRLQDSSSQCGQVRETSYLRTIQPREQLSYVERAAKVLAEVYVPKERSLPVSRSLVQIEFAPSVWAHKWDPQRRT